MTEAIKRPGKRDEAILKAAIQQILPEVLGWLGGDDRPEEVARDLLRAAEDSTDLDGYQLARTLERDCYWDSDTNLVDILEMLSSKVWQLHQKMVADWVKEQGIVPALKVGDKVQCRHGVGTIAEIWLGTAEYVVLIGTDRWLLPFEEVAAKGD